MKKQRVLYLKFAGARHVLINTTRYRTVKVELRSIGKARWPFGWEILRQLSYPEGYWQVKRYTEPVEALIA